MTMVKRTAQIDRFGAPLRCATSRITLWVLGGVQANSLSKANQIEDHFASSTPVVAVPRSVEILRKDIVQNKSTVD